MQIINYRSEGVSAGQEQVDCCADLRQGFFILAALFCLDSHGRWEG